MAQTVRHQPLKAEAVVLFEDIPSRRCGGKNVEIHYVFISVLLFYAVIITPAAHTLYSSSSNVARTRRTNGQELDTFKNESLVKSSNQIQ